MKKLKVLAEIEDGAIEARVEALANPEEYKACVEDGVPLQLDRVSVLHLKVYATSNVWFPDDADDDLDAATEYLISEWESGRLPLYVINGEVEVVGEVIVPSPDDRPLFEGAEDEQTPRT